MTRGRPRLISVVIPVHNAVNTLLEALEALDAQEYDGEWEVLVADNGSTDGSADVARRWLARRANGELVSATECRSAGHARNVAAARARGDFLAFCDSDDVVDAGWLAALAEAAVGGDLVAGPVEVDRLNDGLPRSWHRVSPRAGALERYRFLGYASGSNAGVWADVFHRVGGYNESFRAGEDIEFSWRAQLASFELVWADEAVVHQRLRTEIAALARQHYGYGTTGPRLYRRFREAGMPPRRTRDTLRTWAWILGSAPAIVFSARMRGRWAIETAMAAGRIGSSLRERVLFV